MPCFDFECIVNPQHKEIDVIVPVIEPEKVHPQCCGKPMLKLMGLCAAPAQVIVYDTPNAKALKAGYQHTHGIGKAYREGVLERRYKEGPAKPKTLPAKLVL